MKIQKSHRGSFSVKKKHINKYLLILLLCHVLLIQAREYRTLNGTCNNIVKPLQGSIQQPALLSIPGNYTVHHHQ